MTTPDATISISPLPALDPCDLTSLGEQRCWRWRGWRVRYTVLRASQPSHNPPLMLLHGFGASLDQWRDNLAPLARDRTVYALDLLGFGASQKAAIAFNTDLWRSQVAEFCQTFIGQPVVLVGHSLGALVALTTAVESPALVSHLVLLTLPAAREELLSGWVETLSRLAERAFSTPLLIRPLFAWVRQPWVIRGALGSIYQVRDRVDDGLVHQFVAPTRDRGAARTLCYLVRSRTDEHFTPQTQILVPKITQPTLLLWGQRDRVIPLRWGQRLAPLNPRVTLVEVPEAGHCLYDEYPEQINHHIQDWLATVEPAGAEG